MRRRIWWDVSYLFAHPELSTGIQRVVRELGNAISELCKDTDLNYSFYPCITDADGKVYQVDSIPYPNKVCNILDTLPVELNSPDIFLIADSAWETHKMLGLSAAWRSGVTFGVIQYDLIPITHPHTTTEYMTKVFTNWMLECFTFADFFGCISATTEKELRRTTLSIAPWRELGNGESFNFTLAPFKTVYTTNGHSKRIDSLDVRRTFLAVGTLEPRKRYDVILDAFELLWEKDPTPELTIIGKMGWHTESIRDRIYHLKSSGFPITWMENANDAELTKCYSRATALIAASEQEGFGLPLIEAISVGLPVIASDISVFREVGNDELTYFDPANAKSLADILAKVISGELILQNPNNIRTDISWEMSAREFMAGLDICAQPKQKIRKLYDSRVAGVLAQTVTERIATSDTNENPNMAKNPLSENGSSLKGYYKRIVSRRYAGYGIRLGVALLKSASTRHQLFQAEKRIDELANEQHALTRKLDELNLEIRFVETRLSSLMALENEHSNSMFNSIIDTLNNNDKLHASTLVNEIITNQFGSSDTQAS